MIFEKAHPYQPVVDRWASLLRQGWHQDRDPHQLWYLSHLNEAGREAVQMIWEIGRKYDAEGTLAADWEAARKAHCQRPYEAESTSLAIQEAIPTVGGVACTGANVAAYNPDATQLLLRVPVSAATDR